MRNTEPSPIMGANRVRPAEARAESSPRNPTPLRRTVFWSIAARVPNAREGTPAAPRAPARIANSRLRISVLRSKNDLHLYPHGANAAIGEIAIQEAPGRRTIDAHLWNLDKLRMIECVERFPAQFQAPSLAQRN